MDSKSEVSLVRPFDFSDRDYHLNKWKEKNITVLICQRNTNDLIRLSLESLLRFYPDIPILIMEEGSQDESVSYLKYKALTHPNIQVVTGTNKVDRFTSHGVAMDNALKNHITTKYVLLMDSDVIIERGGLIEDMLDEFPKDDTLYAIGSLMRVTRSNHACGAPKDESDVLRYAHPSFSIYRTDLYHKINAPFTDHGAPCVYSMLAAEVEGYKIGYYPVDKYVSHLSGGSWTDPRTIWANDHGVFLRPFVTFILRGHIHLSSLHLQTDHDFDIITESNLQHANIVVHGKLPQLVENRYYDIRHKAFGEYICIITDSLDILQPHFVTAVKQTAIEQNMPDIMNVGGLECIKRTVWQKEHSLR